MSGAVMSLFGSIVGGIVGAELDHVVAGYIQQHGGLSALVQKFESQGMGNIVQSWISNGPNQSISADQLHQVLGSDAVTQLAAKFGLNPQDVAQKLSQILPSAVDKMTPDGVIPNS
ncbi:MAG: YidB family protein [Steroidobacter sp.]